MVILKLLSEEVFDFGEEEMTQRKQKALKDQMCGEFSEIFQLCREVLEQANKPSLISATLETLLRFLNWIPLGYVFDTNIVDILLKLMDKMEYRNATLKCLTEIGSLIEKWKPTALIVGMPLQMDDAKQLMSFAAKRFMNRLYMHFKLPVFEVDERLSSWEALDRRNAAGNYAKTREDRNKMHAEAAALLLEQWMRETPTN